MDLSNNPEARTHKAAHCLDTREYAFTAGAKTWSQLSLDEQDKILGREPALHIGAQENDSAFYAGPFYGKREIA
jgi:hypothetical protein